MDAYDGCSHANAVPTRPGNIGDKTLELKAWNEAENKNTNQVMQN